MFDIYEIFTLLAVGAIAGWLAGVVMRGRGMGLVGNIIIGLVGAFLAGLLFKQFPGITLGLHYSWLRQIVQGFVGAVILLAVIGFLNKK